MEQVWKAPSAIVEGDVVLSSGVNIWHNAVLRGDCGTIQVGKNTNIQDNCVLHEKTTVGKGCTVGHSAILHGCIVGDDCVIGMGAIVLNNAVIGNHCLVGAGAVVTSKMNAPEGSLILGNPAKVAGQLSQAQIDYIHADCRHYLELAAAHLPTEQL